MKSQKHLKQLHSKDYVEKYEKKPILRISRLLKEIYLNKSHNVLDCACGNAMLMELISPNVRSYTGVDFSKDFINAAEKRKKESRMNNATFYCQDINTFLKTRKNKFDSAFALDFSEHVYDDDWLEILKSIRNSLKKDAILYIHTPNSEYFIEMMKDKQLILKQFPEHIAVRNINENIKLLELAGFSKVTCTIFSHYNILKCLHWISYIPYVGKYFKARLFIKATK